MAANDWLNCNLTELRTLYADRERDLAFEYERANAAEAESAALISELSDWKIEGIKLRAKVERLRGEVAFDGILAPLDSAEILALRAEVARLRAALAAIAELPPHGYGAEMCAYMQGVAQSAVTP